MKQQYFRAFAAAMAFSAVLAVFRLETRAFVRFDAQRGNASVLIDFRALAPDSQPVVDLKAEDVSIKIDGKERAVSSVRFVQSTRKPGRQLPAPFVTNVTGDGGHDVLILVDDESIAPGHEKGIRDVATRLMATLGPGDRTALYGVRPGGLNVPLGSEPARVGDALASMVGQLGDQELTCRTSLALQRIASILTTRAFNPAIVVFFSSGLASPESGMRSQLGVGGKLCEVRTTDFDEVAKAAALSRVSFFPVLVMDGTGRTDTSQDAAAGVEHLAAIVGADPFRLSGTVEPLVARIRRDMSQYYVASVDIEPGEYTDSSRRLEVRAKRAGVRVQAKSQLIVGKAAPSAPAPRDMLRTANTYHDLPLRIAAYPSRGADEKAGVKVVALFEALDPSVKLSAAAIGFYDDKGTLKAQWTAQPPELARSPVPAAVVVPAGAYRVRLAATDATGRSGTADFPLQAQLTPLATFRTSALMLGVAQNNAFAPKLQFGTEPAAVAVLEIYGVPKSAAVTARLELAESDQGAPLANATTNVGQGPGDDGRTAFGGFAIAGLQPGDYLLRAIVTVDGKEAGRATRILRKVQP
jgi:hypothetical protein